MVKEKLKGILQNDKIVIPSLILFLIIFAYGLLAPWQGFYWDDWAFAWLLKSFGPTDFIQAFIPFRPLLGPIFTATTTLFGSSPFIWQLVGLVVRFLLSWELWGVLRTVWPSQKWNSAWVVFLFTIFPGYQQQWVALTHVNQEFIPFTWLMASFWLTILALRNERSRTRLTLFAVTLQVLGLFSTEYLFGLEIFRLFFVVIVIAEAVREKKEILRKAISCWSPYLVVWIINAMGIYAYHDSSFYNSYELSGISTLSFTPLAILNELINTFALSGFSSWSQALHLFSTVDGTLTQMVSLGILLVTALGLIYLMPGLFTQAENQHDLSNKNDIWGWQAMLIGLIGIFAGRLPSWAAGLPLKLEFDYDRLMISIMLGASLFVIGLISLMVKEGRRKVVILGLLIGLSTAYQFSVSNSFRRDWENQKNFLWELSWRIPALQPGTVLLARDLPLAYVSDMQISAPINWIYAPDLADRKMPYLLLYIKSRLRSLALPSLQPDTPIKVIYRTATFEGDTSNSVVIYKNADGCLRVLDPVYENSETLPGENEYLLDAIRLSNPDLISVNAPQPKLDGIFGPKPEHGWCFFYEKASIARQLSDWSQVVKLYGQAQKNGLSPLLPVENLPFIEGLAMTGRPDEALQLTGRTIKGQPVLCPALHTLWGRVAQAQKIPANVKNTLDEDCKP